MSRIRSIAERSATPMKMRVTIPSVGRAPTDRPRACVHCGQPILQGHGAVSKPIKDHRFSRVIAHRYKCLSCGRTFRHYPPGITKKDQSRGTVVLATLMYGLGLSSSTASRHLSALGVQVNKTMVWRDAKEAGGALRRTRPAGRVRVLEASETVFGGQRTMEVVVGFVDGQTGRTLGFEVLFEGNGKAFNEWLESYARGLGAEVVVPEPDNDSSGVANSE